MKPNLEFYFIIITFLVVPLFKATPTVFGEKLSDEREEDAERNVVPEQRTITRIKKDIKIKKVTFSCGFTIYHTRIKVDMTSSKFSCTPSKPTKQIALRVPLVGKNGFSFKANVQINPNKFNSLKITEVPSSGGGTTKAPSPPTTTDVLITKASSTTSPTTKTTPIATETAARTATTNQTTKTTTSTTTTETTSSTVTTETTETTTSLSIGGQSLTTSGVQPQRNVSAASNLRCGCKCNCPDSRLNCPCTCECPAPHADPLLFRGLCAPGFTKVCPYQPVGCPDNMEHVCPVEIINHIHGVTSTEEEFDTTSTSTTTSTRKPVPTKAPFIQTRKVQSIRIKRKTFKCSFVFTHNYTDITRSFARCTPSKPKNQKITRVKIVTDDYTFQVNMHVNPTRVNVAKMISAPPTPPPSTTTTSTSTTSTTTTLPPFNENGCDCMADFLLLLYSIPSFDRSLNGEVHLVWSVGAKNVDRKLFEGPHITHHSLPLMSQVRGLDEGCYCVGQGDYYTSTAISSTGTQGTTPTTAWTPAVTANTTATVPTE